MAKRKVRHLASQNADDVSAASKRLKRRKRKSSISLHSVWGRGWSALEAWLQSAGAIMKSFEVRTDNCMHGMGAFAKADVKAGEVIFTVPRTSMLTPVSAVEDSVVRSVADLLTSWGEKSVPELLISIRLCRARLLADDHFHTYAASLPSRASGAASWSASFRRVLLQTSLGPSVQAADKELDYWEALLQRVSQAKPSLLQPTQAFTRESLEWARGMLQSREFPGSFGGLEGEGSLCMVPLLDILNHDVDADVSIRVKAGYLEFISDTPLCKGQQIWNNYGSKTNEELLMCYGFALENNECDSIVVPLLPDANTEEKPSMGVMLSADGIPEDVKDAIESEENGNLFASLMKSLIGRRAALQECLQLLDSERGEKLCKRPLARARRRNLEIFLNGQISIVEICLREMHGHGPSTT